MEEEDDKYSETAEDLRKTMRELRATVSDRTTSHGACWHKYCIIKFIVFRKSFSVQ